MENSFTIILPNLLDTIIRIKLLGDHIQDWHGNKMTDSVKQISRMGKVPIIAVVERRGEVIYYHLSKSYFRELL